jgi:hypothetical protein
MQEIMILEFLDGSGRSPFARWFGGLNAVAAARQSVAIATAQAAWAPYKRGEGRKELRKWH